MPKPNTASLAAGLSRRVSAVSSSSSLLLLILLLLSPLVNGAIVKSVSNNNKNNKDIVDMQSVWNNWDITEYYLQLKQSTDSDSSFGIFVRDNLVIKVIDDDGHALRDLTSFNTVLQWFSYIQNNNDDNQGSDSSLLTVTYDDKYGFPTHIHIESVSSSSSLAVQDVEISNFVPTSIYRQELMEQREKWNSFGYTSYEIRLRQSQTVSSTASSSRTIQVHDGQQVALKMEDSTSMATQEQEDESANVDSSFLSAAQTMDQVFDRIESYLDDGVTSYQVKFDETYGYPTDIRLKSIKNDASDSSEEELDVTMGALSILSDAPGYLYHARQLFLGLDVATYKYEVRDNYLDSQSKPSIILVEDDQVVTKQDADSTVAALTIMEWFNILSQAVNDDEITYKASFHPEFGYPTRIQMADKRNNVETDISFHHVALYSVYERELDQAESMWQQANIAAYSYEIQQICFCEGSASVPKRVRVSNGQTLSVTDLQGQDMSQDDVPSISDLFQSIRTAIDGRYDEVSADFNMKTHGIPSRVRLVPSMSLPDAFDFFSVSSLQQLRLGDAGDLEFARSVWKDAHIYDYNYGYQRTVDRVTESLVVEVQSSAVYKVSDQAEHAVLASERSLGLLTFDQIFDQIALAIQDGRSIDAVYDKRYGIPTSFRIGADDTGSDDGWDAQITFLTPYSELREELDSALRSWRTIVSPRGNYKYKIQISCNECTSAEQETRVAFVRDGEISYVMLGERDAYAARGPSSYRPDSVSNTRGGSIRGRESVVRVQVFDEDLADNAPTIPDLFASIQEAIDSRYWTINVSYEDFYGYPTIIKLDRVDGGMEQTQVTISDFELISK